MAKDKYDFISEMLENKKLSPTQKVKLFMLSAEELKKDKLGGLNLEERINKIEKVLKIAPQPLKKQVFGNEPRIIKKDSPLRNTLPNKYIDPSNLSRFLQAYNENSILKTTCHEIDEDELENICEITNEANYNFEKHYQEIIKTFEELEKKYPEVDYKLLGLIRGYLTGKDKKGIIIKEGWSTNKIKVNWNSPELLIWALENPGSPPNPNETLSEQFNNIGFEFNEIKELHIKSFSELVVHFKKLFHVRRDNSLKDIILNINKKKKWDEAIEFEITEESFRANIEFFTDVDKLSQAYYRIIEIILEISNKEKLSKPKIKLSLSFKEENNTIIFSIHHLNTKCSKTIQNFKERLGQKHSNLIKKQVNGLCNLFLNADFGNHEYAEINLWDGKERVAQKLESFVGVEHKLVITK